jgi:tyrosinase
MRVRYSLEYLQSMYDSGEDKKPLQDLVRAFKGIQELPIQDENSFWKIASYHGEPENYCNHENVLFPTWHRAYLFRIENALRSVPGCEDVAMPFWDETITVMPHVQDASIKTIPSVLTSPKFELDGKEIQNPLCSYKYQSSLADGQGKRWTKPKGYETVRYPLSGLVGDEKMKGTSSAHNMQFISQDSNTTALTNNVKAWLEGTVQIDSSDLPDIKTADSYSAFSRYKICMNSPNYTVFSNTQSQAQWMIDMGHEEGSYYVASIESPHNAIHLALGGFFQYDDKGKYNANPIRGANGDMGANEVASFDPIFYFHHCFVDLVFWNWQRRNRRTSPGSLDVIPGYPGTTLKGMDLDLETDLRPFKKSDGTYFISHDVTNIEDQLDYVYFASSMDQYIWGGGGINNIASPTKLIAVENISTADYSGSFVIRLFTTDSKGKKVEVGREPILSRWDVENCSNCVEQRNIKAIFPISEPYLNAIKGSRAVNDITYSVEIHGTSDGALLSKNGRQPSINIIR